MRDIFSTFKLTGGLLQQLYAFLELQRAYRTGSRPSILPLLYIELIKTCNQKCKHCGYSSDYPESGTLLTTRELIDIINDANKMQTKIISFGGGEPFLREDIFELIAHAQSLGITVHINSNATLLDEEKVLKLAKFSKITLVLSLDHPEPEKNDYIRGQGVYRKVVRAISLLKQYAPLLKIGINCVIAPYNMGKLSDMLKLGKHWGVDSVKFTPVHGNLNHSWKQSGFEEQFIFTNKHYDLVKAEMKELIATSKKLGIKTNSKDYLSHIPDFINGKKGVNCFAGFIYGNIDPYGNLFPCYDYKAELNVRTNGFKAAWQSDEMQGMRKLVKTCQAKCWNTGNAEPSIRMNLLSLLKNPHQIIDDYRFYLS